MSTGRPYLGWRFKFLNWWEQPPAGAVLAIDTSQFEQGDDYVEKINRAVARIHDERPAPCELALRRKAG